MLCNSHWIAESIESPFLAFLLFCSLSLGNSGCGVSLYFFFFFFELHFRIFCCSSIFSVTLRPWQYLFLDHNSLIFHNCGRQDTTAGTQEKALLGGTGVTWLKPPGWGVNGSHFNLSTTVWLDSPSSDQAAGGAGTHFTYGLGGWSCGRYTPAGGFWCSNQSSGGGSGWELMVPGAPLFPVGVTVRDDTWAKAFDPQLRPPNPASWKNKSSAVRNTATSPHFASSGFLRAALMHFVAQQDS